MPRPAARPRAQPRYSTDLAAFGRLYRDCHGLVRSVVRRLGVPAAFVDDAVQDVFVVAHRRRAEFDPTRPAEPWLVGIARRIASRYRRTHSRGERKLEALRVVSDPVLEERPWMRVEAERFLGRFLDQLGAERREVFVLGELQGLTGPEISERLKIPLDTAYTRLRASRLLFERALIAESAQDHPEPPAAVQRAWLLLLPRLSEPGAPSTAGWFAAGLLKAKLAVGAIAVATVAALPLLVPPPAPPDAAATPVQTRRPNATRTAREATAISLPPPPPASRFEALLSQSTDASDELGAAQVAAAVAALAAGDATTALAELDRHARAFPQSPLEQARTLTRIRALCRLGRDREAREVTTRMSRTDLQAMRAQLAATCAAE